MFDLLKKILDGQNQFASGGLLLMILGSVGVFLRSLPSQLWSWIMRQSTMSITVKDDDQAFAWVKEWFLEQKFLKRVRRLDLDTSLRGAEAAMVPAPGRHWFMRGGRPYWVWFWRTENTKGYNQRRMESFMIETIGRDQQVLRQFVAEVVACHKKKLRTASYLYLYDDGWDRVESYWPRRLDSVLLKPGEKEHLIQDLERFRASRDRYRRLGVPYHRGYLFYGPPGTGKTSLVSALAARFGMSVYIVNLSELNDRTLKTAMNWVSDNSVILFEDIDCMNASTRRSQAGGAPRSETADDPKEKSAIDKMGVSLSGLLNVLDGFSAPENVVYAMTTNDISGLDAALLRPGRIDYKLYLGEACESQKVELYRRFFPESSEEEARAFAQANWAETMAEFQGLLLALEQEVGTTEVGVVQS
ncbi:AAA ATPase [Candidatus Koribacter versatilis Ellin345]|uniref:AAA ATPase n=1 Tax=Koribacter versatilis (strain Ellin345) TaxID=204669 RepID=Q1IPF8_KORVE|nr:AAA family ATPase [Candidatus Koribacter versatilis]ABF41242.1 AAA ATPase [Candidatus Koribacter versatilis Ellin345]